MEIDAESRHKGLLFGLIRIIDMIRTILAAAFIVPASIALAQTPASTAPAPTTPTTPAPATTAPSPAPVAAAPAAGDAFEMSCKLFVRNADGSWHTTAPMTLQPASGPIPLKPSSNFKPGRLFGGFDLATALDRACPH